MEIDELVVSINIAESIKDETLKKIGTDAVRGYQADLETRSGWETQNDKWMKLALQVAEEKTYPWQGAANIKYPLLTTAALQFGSRAYPSLVPSFDVVKAKVIGKGQPSESQIPQSMSPQGGPPPTATPPMGMPPMASAVTPEQQAKDDLNAIATTISTHMSYQVLYEMEGWEEDMDKLCLVLPILGCCFKKTYYSAIKKKNCSELILPKDLVINYWAKSIDSAIRKTHVIYLTPNDIVERQRLGNYKEYEDFDFTGGVRTTDNTVSDKVSQQSAPGTEEDTPRTILEQHTFLDLDEDGYKEPYVVTVDLESTRVLRIAARYNTKSIERTAKNKIAKIVPIEYFTQFNFIPNPEGGIYGVGFGLLLGSLNESANTVLNQLVDAGSLSNLQSGFLAKGLRLGKAGDYRFTPGEWKWVNSSYDDLKKGIFPLPVREPSNVLFQLLGMLIQSGKELASIAEIFTGKMPGQNTPASTTMATIEQGLKVFTSIYKRIYRALGKEFEKLYKLNEMYLPEEGADYAMDRDGVIVDGTVSRDLYKQAKVKIVPAADPNMVSETQKLILLQGLQELAQFGNINPRVLTQRGLEMQGQPGIAELMEMPPSGPPPEIQMQIDELAFKKESFQAEMVLEEKRIKLETEKLSSESLKRSSEVFLNLAKAEAAGTETNLAQIQAYVQSLSGEEEAHRNRIGMMVDMHNAEEDRKLQEATNAARASKQGGMG